MKPIKSFFKNGTVCLICSKSYLKETLYLSLTGGVMVKFEGGNAEPIRMAVKKNDISLILKNNTKN